MTEKRELSSVRAAGRRRRVRNEVLFREVNERIARLSGDGGGFEPLVVLCECGREECVEQVDVRPRAYEAVRTHGRRFVVKHGHEDATLEQVVVRERGYVVVEKVGDAGDMAERHDPRDDGPDAPTAA